MKMMFQGVSKAISGLRAELVASQKGKEKVSFEETADVEAAGVKVLEMMSSMPGDNSFLSKTAVSPSPASPSVWQLKRRRLHRQQRWWPRCQHTHRPGRPT
ncbi:uncharacterized protein ACA1_285530 [Acanthamoeba castellanii str. Neff]|uniref:Uncharacterized protein n=1 Tax=Acanthamoeba castellanii (strain ATCC 30010 / Neff) TaxID=1257118 RepID=L8H6R0_ACACF|nr:uncharacterized protein ACA1_285530 [Acanthamoeba castellanii str. Neff]ELR21194.1 hypothetical protein ACA1_285530 [Acanthamoeba castellanii str. Neff]